MEKEKTQDDHSEELEKVSEEKTTEPLSEENIQLDKDFSVGYLAGIQNDGKFFFRSFGHTQELTGLLGSHMFATENIEVRKQNVLMTGDAITKQLIGIVKAMDEKLTVVLARLSAPSNKL